MGRTGFIRDQLDIRILVLYLMSRVAGPVDFVTLADLAFCDEGVTYFNPDENGNITVLTNLLLDGETEADSKARMAEYIDSCAEQVINPK